MATRANVYRHYDTRIKTLVALSRNPHLFPEQSIPRSTARYWAKKGRVRSLQSEDESTQLEAKLTLELQAAKIELCRLYAVLKLLQSASGLAGNTISWRRFPKREQKERFLKIIDEAKSEVPLSQCLELVGLSHSRYKAWKVRSLKCLLKDRSSCLKISPQQLTSNELAAMARLYQDTNLKHFSQTSLALFAQRTGQVYCSPRTWSKYARILGWDRKRVRIYPTRNKPGVRAHVPNQIWHIDVTQIRLASGEVRYVQAVIDNYSRYVLAWRVSDGRGGMDTKKTIQLALKNSAKILGKTVLPTLYSDAGCENVNSNVGSLIRTGKITHTIAQTDVSFSNSMIEALFNALKNRYLYHQILNSPAQLTKAVDFYFTEHNEHIPQQVLGGAKPIEIFQGGWSKTERLALMNRAQVAREQRKCLNKAASCSICKIEPMTEMPYILVARVSSVRSG